MNPLFVFGLIFSIVFGVYKLWTKNMTPNENVCHALQEEQKKEIASSKKVTTIILVVCMIITIIGLVLHVTHIW